MKSTQADLAQKEKDVGYAHEKVSLGDKLLLIEREKSESKQQKLDAIKLSLTKFPLLKKDDDSDSFDNCDDVHSQILKLQEQISLVICFDLFICLRTHFLIF